MEAQKDNVGFTKFFLFLKNTLKFWYFGLIISCIIQIIFMMVIIFHHKLTDYLAIAEYITFAFNICVASMVLYHSYIYSNKAFISDIIFLIMQLCFLAFLIPTTLYFGANITQQRIDNMTTSVTIDLTQEEYIYTSISLWFDFIFIGSSIVTSIVCYYYSAKISKKPWNLRVENERVISKPKN